MVLFLDSWSKGCTSTALLIKCRPSQLTQVTHNKAANGFLLKLLIENKKEQA